MKTKIFWCKVNKYYTEEWLNSDYLKGKNGIFIASCVVTDRAKRKWLKFVKDSIKDLWKWEKIYISWCWAFKDWKAQNDFFVLYPELEEFKENIEILDEKPDQPHPLAPSPEGEGGEQSFINSKLIVVPKNLYTKKFVVIQGGCDSFCTFCLTVKKRWRHFFRLKEDIVKEILDFEKNWGKEVVLTWINLWAWWLSSTNEKGSKLYELLKYILDNTSIWRIRISSLWPEFIDDKLIELFKETRVYPHIHISVQSWSSKILKSMARHYDAEDLKSILKKIKGIKRDDGVDISLWADIIVWFPWEFYDDFKETYELVKEFKINKLHSFPFSAHKIWENVVAGSFDNQVDEVEKKKRLEKLNKLWDKIRNEFIESQRWKTLKVLIEFVKWWEWKWWSENYVEVNNDNFEVVEWEVRRNEVVVGRLR